VWLAPVALTPLLIALAREGRLLHRFLLGYAAGIVYWFGVCYWIQYVLQTYGGMGVVGSWGAFLLFCIAKALQMGAFAFLAAIVLGRVYALPAVAALWVAIEWTHGPLGFAWLALGNAGIGMSVPMRLAPFTGVYGLSFVFLMMCTALALVILRRKRRELLWLLSLPLLYLLPALPAPQRGTESAVLVQPNLSEGEQWTMDSVDRMQRELFYLSLHAASSLKDHSPQLLVWPELPAPLYYYDDPQFREAAINLARVARTNFLFGTVAYTSKGAPLNSAVMLAPSGEMIGRYDKMNLVPFGEFVPPLFGFVNRITQEAGDFQPGKTQVIFPVNGHSAGVFICYEAVFPDFVRRFAANGAQLFVNISNDGYFGRSAAREQHLKIVRMRAAENQRWILRSTNDGITVTIDPAGRIVNRLPPHKQAALITGYSYVDKTTLYTRYGDWFVLLCAVAGLVALVVSQIPRYRREANHGG
jgi:apolipoprotein N-acyltransferase